MKKNIASGLRTRKVLDKEYDIVVIGGGVAGTCAAIAAARMGRRVALIQDRPVLGGNSSSEVRVWAIGASTQGYFRNARETGILEELTLEAAYLSEGLPPVYAEPYPMWDLVLAEACRRQPTLDLYLNTHAYQVEMEENKILSVSALQTSTELSFRFKARYFIESSGDGEIGALAGAAWRIGQESQDEFNESLAPEESNDKVLPSSILFSTVDVGRPASFHPPDWAYRFPREEDFPFRNHSYVRSGYWWISVGGDTDTINHNEAIRDELHKVLYGVWDHIKNHGDHGAQNLALNWVGQIVGKRESRRFEGDIILTQQDVLSGRSFTDGVAYGGWPLDLHPSEGFFDRDVPTDQVEVERPYSIPYRALYSRNIENLFLNGRLISASHVAMGSIRVQKTLGLVGQAVGSAAALCSIRNLTPRQLGENGIKELQQELLRQDCFIPHVRNRDPRDLARGAQITASSSMVLPAPAADDCHPLDIRRAQKFVVSKPRLERLWLRLASQRAEAVEITARLYAAEDLWDFRAGEALTTARATLGAQAEEWLRFELGCEVDPDRPVWVVLEPVDGVFWQRSLDEPYGCQAAGWSFNKMVRLNLDAPDPQNAVNGSSEGIWRFLRGTYLFRVEPQPTPYGPENVANGVTRPEDGANLWIADPDAPWPHWLELDFGSQVRFNTVQLTFDSNFNRQMDEDASVITGRVPEIMQKYTGFAWQQGEWRKVFEEADNHQRQRVHTFQAVESQRLRLEFYPPDGYQPGEMTLYSPKLSRKVLFPPFTRVQQTARVFEVRVY